MSTDPQNSAPDGEPPVPPEEQTEPPRRSRGRGSADPATADVAAKTGELAADEFAADVAVETGEPVDEAALLADDTGIQPAVDAATASYEDAARRAGVATQED